MKNKLRVSASKSEIKNGVPQNINSVIDIDPNDSSEEIACKISNILTDIKIPDGRSDLEQKVDSLIETVNTMIKAGIEVPNVYKDFLNLVRPDQNKPKEIEILKKPPLFKIEGLDENGAVKVKTENPLIIKKGNTEISLTYEKLTKPLGLLLNKTESINNDVKEDEDVTSDDIDGIIKELEDEIVNPNNSPEVGLTIQSGNVTIENMKKANENDITNFIGIDEKGVLKKIEIPSSVNKNAYELRNDILKLSAESVNRIKEYKNLEEHTKDVLITATKYYEFVENKYKNR